MTARAPDPRRLDLAAFAEAAAMLQGRWPLAGFKRLVEVHAQDGVLDWTAQGQTRAVAGAASQCWLHLSGHALVKLECQRCLKPVDLPIEVSRSLRFVETEEEAQALDAVCEDDVLAGPRRLDLHGLIEDELLLSLPLVPMHERCPDPLPMGTGELDDGVASHPFAALQGLARQRRQ